MGELLKKRKRRNSRDDSEGWYQHTVGKHLQVNKLRMEEINKELQESDLQDALNDIKGEKIQNKVA